MFEFNKIAKELNQKYFYHIKPDKEIKEIIPLSMLKDKDKKAYNKAIKKYTGREDQLTTKISLLDAEWQDCINLSTINPALLFDLIFLLRLKNYDYNPNRTIIKFPIEVLKDKRIVLYDDNKNFKKDEAYSKLNIKSYKELKYIPEETVKYYIQCMKKNEDPLIFASIPHILCLDPIKISDGEEFVYDRNKLY